MSPCDSTAAARECRTGPRASLGLPLATASSFAELYPTVPERLKLAAEMSTNPTLLVLYGRFYDPTTAGGLVAWRMGRFLPVLIALMSLLLVARQTRGEEQAGRLKLVGSGGVGHRAPTGAFAHGFGLAGAGLGFATIAAVATQQTEDARTASGLAAVVLPVHLGASYLLRASVTGPRAAAAGRPG